MNPVESKELEDKATSLFTSSLYKDALQYFDKITKAHPTLVQAWHYKGVSLSHLGRHDEAIESYNIALKIDPNFAQAWYYKGVSLVNISTYTYAIKCFDMTLLLDPNFAQAWYYKGFVFVELGNYKKALEMLDRTTDLDPNFAQAWYYKGVSLSHLGRHDEAIESYYIWIKRNPNKKYKDYLILLLAKIKRYFHFFLRFRVGLVELDVITYPDSHLVSTVATEIGIEGKKVKIDPSTEASKKIEEEFEKSFEQTLRNRSLKQFREFKDFSDWFTRVIQDNPDMFLSRISNDLIKDVMQTTKPYYSTLFVRGITTQIRRIINSQGISRGEEYRIHGLALMLQPLEFYVELSKFVDEVTRTLVLRLTFKLDTDIRIDRLKVSSLKEFKAYIETLVANIRLSVSRITVLKQNVTHIYKPTELAVLLDKHEIRLDDITIIGYDRDINIWIKNLENYKIQNSNEPLIKGNRYELKISLGKNIYSKPSKRPRTEESVATDDTKTYDIAVSIFGEAFTITENTKELSLKTVGATKAISFKIEPRADPKYNDVQQLKIYFHYKHNLLQVLSIFMKVVDPPAMIDKILAPTPLRIKFKENEKFISAHIISSSNLGFDKI